MFSNHETVFSLAGTLVLPMWLLLVIAPYWKFTQFLIRYKIIPLILSVLYAIYLSLAIQGGSGLDFGSLAAVMELFTIKDALLAGWIHYLAFDLLIGMWMVTKNRELKIHPILMAPCLATTFMMGPVGFLLFSIIQSIKSRTNESS
ncbi:ABA4-like family protein [Aureitalea marina]|uniref:DUF4281 domain-containing protein n=1 Tax=Aureitalea marina TaxID=930804 RepID=A0A2S7KTW1_9FLAO|nr:ABA4-like family protein [Aureitalea marina]PQB06081.1 hypothetical protein BST85_13025 [Aureitalea marina]